jgi:hypothetical protein
MISAIARPSSEPAASSSSVVTWAGRLPEAWLVAMPPATRLIESEMTPTLTPDPLVPMARACGPWWAASPCDRMVPLSVPSVPPPASDPSVIARTAVTACTSDSPAASSSAPAGSQPATARSGARSLVPLTRMPRPLSRAAAAETEPLT